jgi:hypothetical protein
MTTGTAIMFAVAYLVLGGYLGLIAAWEATAYRPAMPRPTLDVAVGGVVLFVTVTWPLWVIGWTVWHRQTRRRQTRRPKVPGWLHPQAWAGAGVLILIAAILWEGHR